MISFMHKQELEPGVLQVFRLYAWLQTVSYLVLPAWRLLFDRSMPDIPRSTTDIWALVLVTCTYSIFLLVMLYWTWLQEKLGMFFIPLTIGLAAGGLLLDQRLFHGRALPWQGYPFLTILLILVAWQYRYRYVALFTLGIAAFETVLNQLFPAPLFIRAPGPDSDPQSSYAFLAAYAFLLANTVTFLVIGYVVNRLVSAQRKQRQALAEANQKLISHAATLEQLTASRERIRLSRELHDTLAHTLSAQTVQLEALLTYGEAIPARARNMLEQMLDATRNGLDETRRVLSALRPSVLESLGLPAAVKARAQDCADRAGLKLTIEIIDELDDLPAEVEQCFYRVAQEALENIARHAEATRLEVYLTQQNGHLQLIVSDDGKGFTSRQIQADEQLGLRGMYERAELIGAGLDVDSQPDKGTRVRLEWQAKP
jgi:signal transduction histidine kinase